MTAGVRAFGRRFVSDQAFRMAVIGAVGLVAFLFLVVSSVIQSL